MAKCPDFELAKLQRFSSEIFLSDVNGAQKTAGFILSLALAFNDIKGLIWFRCQLEKGKPSTTTLSEYYGQHTGMQVQIVRLLIGLLTELLQLIRENQQTLEHDLIKRSLKKMPKKEQTAWHELVKTALESNPNNNKKGAKLTQLAQIRSNGTFHYYQCKGLLKGYKEHCKSSNSEMHKNAYISVGSTMMNSRFYFADAAAQGVISEIINSSDINDLDIYIKNNLNNLNLAVKCLVKEYMILVQPLTKSSRATKRKLNKK